MIDGKRYLRLKDKGLTRIVERDNGCYLQFTRFDIEEGFITDPEEQKINLEEINKRKDDIEKELKGIELLLTELDILHIKVKDQI